MPLCASLILKVTVWLVVSSMSIKRSLLFSRPGLYRMQNRLYTDKVCCQKNSCLLWPYHDWLISHSKDDADAGEIKRAQKPIRRNRKKADSNQGEGLNPDWDGHRSSVSSHSSGDEGEESLHKGPEPPISLLELSQPQATPNNYDMAEMDGDPKKGNTCNALSGDLIYIIYISYLMYFPDY